MAHIKSKLNKLDLKYYGNFDNLIVSHNYFATCSEIVAANIQYKFFSIELSQVAIVLDKCSRVALKRQIRILRVGEVNWMRGLVSTNFVLKNKGISQFNYLTWRQKMYW